MSRYVPPGIALLIQLLPTLVTPPLISALLYRLLGFHLRSWFFGLVLILSYPLGLTLSVQYDWYRKRQKAAKMGAVLPTPVEHNTIGGLDILARLKETHHNGFPGVAFHTWALKYGWTFNFRTLFKDRIFTCDPEHIKKMLIADFSSFEKGPEFRDQMKQFLGDGVFNADGEIWKFHRAMTRPFFARDRISHFDIFDKHTEDAIAQAKARMEEGIPIDFMELVLRVTLDSASEFLIGTDLHTLSAKLSYPLSMKLPKDPQSTQEFAQAFQEAQEVSSLRPYFGTLWPLTEFWKDKLLEPMRTIDAFVMPLVEAAIARKAQAKADDTNVRKGGEVGEDDTLLEHLVTLTDDAKIIKDETLNILLAGRDSTAATLTFSVYVLAEHPEVLKKLRAEVIDHVGSRRPTFDDIRNLRYLRAFINEILRLYPAVPFDIRYAVRDSLWPPFEEGGKPILVEAGTGVLYSVGVMHRRTDLWGPDAAEFDPDRFLDERCHKYIVPNPFIFLPFNGGPRICLGQQFAYNEISFVLIRLLQHFSSFELAQEEANPAVVPSAEWAQSPGSNGKDRVKLRLALVMSVEGGLWVRMKDANAKD